MEDLKMKIFWFIITMVITTNVSAIDFTNLEPSGITMLNNSTYIVSDNGKLLHIDSQGNDRVYEIDVKKKYRDFEGITTDGEYLFVAIEGKDAIMVMDTKFNVLNIVKIDREFKGKKVLHKKGNGIESLAFIKKKGPYYHFISANQSNKTKGKDRSSIFKFKMKIDDTKVKIQKYHPLTHIDIAALCVYNKSIYAISDKEDKLIRFDMDFNEVGTYNLDKGEQEGLFVSNGIMYIVDDEGAFYKKPLPAI